jgi:hypothetical protein
MKNIYLPSFSELEKFSRDKRAIYHNTLAHRDVLGCYLESAGIDFFDNADYLALCLKANDFRLSYLNSLSGEVAGFYHSISRKVA